MHTVLQVHTCSGHLQHHKLPYGFSRNLDWPFSLGFRCQTDHSRIFMKLDVAVQNENGMQERCTAHRHATSEEPSAGADNDKV